MATVYQNPSLSSAGNCGSYSTYQEPDTRIPPKASPVFKAVAVNGVTVPEADILAEAQNHPADTPGAALSEAARALVIRELLRQEAERLGIAGGSCEGADGRAETKIDAAIRILIDAEVRAPAASVPECRRYYEKHPAKFCSEPLYEARHILVAAPLKDKVARADARALAERLCAHLATNPRDFALLAEEHSACSSRTHGGNLGQVTSGSTVRQFERALGTMHEGAISPQPVETRFGFHVIALDRKISGKQLPFEAVSGRIAGWLEASAWSKAVSQYISVLAGRAVIEGIDLDCADGPLLQ